MCVFVGAGLFGLLDESATSMKKAYPSINRLRLNDFSFNPLSGHLVLSLKFVKQICYENVLDNCIRVVPTGWLRQQ